VSQRRGERVEMARRLDEQSVEISLPNKIGYERIAMACSASFARMVGFVPERIEDLKSAVAEACINAMQHGNKWRPEARVVVNMNFRDDTFIVSVMDEGNGMPEVPEYPGVVRIIEEEKPTRGLGVFMIQQLVDRVKFNQTTTEGHVVTIEIKLNT
jgi:serine/threonine-protein kinase RsbW